MIPDARSILPHCPEREIRSHQVRVEGVEVYCWNCENQFGVLRNGNLIKPTSIITNRTIFRCINCNEKNEFKPSR